MTERALKARVKLKSANSGNGGGPEEDGDRDRDQAQEDEGRGGWQGARMMQILFALGLGTTMHKTDSRLHASSMKEQQQGQFARPRPTLRIGLQDDTYFVGSAKAIGDMWPAMMEQLTEAGHDLPRTAE